MKNVPRNRGSQIETVCKLLTLLASGRNTKAELAIKAELSKKTIHRYIMVMSIYFVIQEEEIEGERYLWMEDQRFGVRRGIKRFCSKGHDKFGPHGGYWIKRKDKTWLICAVCTRARNNAWYEKQKRGTAKWW